MSREATHRIPMHPRPRRRPRPSVRGLRARNAGHAGKSRNRAAPCESAWRIESRVKSCTNCGWRKRTSIFAGWTFTSTSSQGKSRNSSATGKNRPARYCDRPRESRAGSGDRAPGGDSRKRKFRCDWALHFRPRNKSVDADSARLLRPASSSGSVMARANRRRSGRNLDHFFERLTAEDL